MGHGARVAAAAVLAWLLAACGSFESYAAEVNGRRISQDELNRELEAILGNERYLEQVDQGFAAGTGEPAKGAGNGTFNSVFVAAVLDRRIGFELIRQEVQRRGIRITPEQRRSTRQSLEEDYTPEVFRAFPERYREELVQVFAEVAALQEAMRGTVDDAAVREFYEANPELFAQTCVRHILVESEAKAAELKTRIDTGADFAALARAESTDNGGGTGGSAAQGGELGCVTPGQFVPEFEQAMAGLQPGQVSAPVRTQFGFHLIQVTDRKTLSFEEAAPQIRANLERQGNDPVQQYIAEALGRAEIKVNPRYGKFVKTGPNPGVQAPKLLDAPPDDGEGPAGTPPGEAPAPSPSQ